MVMASTRFLAQLCGLWSIYTVMTVAHAQSAPESCVHIARMQPRLDHREWHQDTAYEIAVREDGDKLQVSIVGDLVVLDSSRFASIVRSVDKAAPNIKRISIDAREIRILDPITIQNGWIALNGVSVSFEGRGALILTKAATSDEDGISINAHIVDLRTSNQVPLQLTLAGGRKLQVNAKVVESPQGSLQGRDAANALWRRTTNFEGTFPSVYPSGFLVEVSAKGLATANDLMRDSAWPSYTAFKVSKHHAIAPFDTSSSQQLVRQIAALRPVLADLDQAQALLTVEAVASLIDQGLDVRGRTAAYVSSRDFVAAKGDFLKSIEATEKQLKNWAAVIAQIHSSPEFDNTAFKQVEERIAASEAKETERQEALDKVFLNLSGLGQRLNDINAKLAVDRQRVQEQLKEIEQNQAQLEAIETVTTVAAVAVSFVGTPAAGAALAAGVSAAGGVVYQHNAGEPANVETLASIVSKSAQVYSNVFAARKTWEQHRADRKNLDKVMRGDTVMNGDKPFTKTEAAKKAVESAGAFASKMKAAADQAGSVTKPDMVQQTKVEKDDTVLQEHLLELADTQLQISEQMHQAKIIQEGMTAGAAEMSDAFAARYSLVTLKPVNNQEVLRWKAAALQFWRTQLRVLYEQAADLRRSLYFETWQSPSLPKELAAYPEEMTAYLAAGRYTPETNLGTSPAKLTEAHLNGEIDKHLGALRGYSTALEEVWDTYSKERAGGVEPYTKAFVAYTNISAPPHTKFFIQQLNAQIRNQINFPKLRRTGGQLPILIPLELGTPHENRPERLVDIFVANVKFKDEGALVGKDVTFDVQVRMAGELRKGQQCVYVDLAGPGGSNMWTRRRNDARTPLGALEQQSKLPMSFDDLRNKATAPPARSLYFMSINVDGSEQDGNWKRVPEIETLTVLRRIVQ